MIRLGWGRSADSVVPIPVANSGLLSTRKQSVALCALRRPDFPISTLILSRGAVLDGGGR
jgi:hypothetical protein